MRKKSIRLVSMTVIIALITNIVFPMKSFFAFAMDKPNLFLNSGFEDGVKYWTTWKGTKNLNIDIDSSQRKTGKKSLKMYSNSSSLARGSASQIIDSQKMIGKTLQLNQWVKSENFIGSVQVRVRFLDAKLQSIGETDTKEMYISSNSNWQLKKYSIDVPNNSKIKKVGIEYIYNNSKGKLWIDDIATNTVATVKTSNIIKNSSFEDDFSYWAVWKEKDNFKAEIDNNTRKTGSNSLKLYNGNNQTARGIVSQKINIASNLQGKVLKVKQWVKTNKLSGEGIEVRIGFNGNNDVQLAPKETYILGVSQTQDWRQVEYNIYLPKNNNLKSITIEYIFDKCTGTVWFDDLNEEENLTGSNKNLVQNGSFESTLKNVANGWTTWNNVKYSTETGDKIDGNASLKATAISENKEARITQYIPITSDILGKSVKLSQWIKTVKSNNLRVSVYYWDGNNAEVTDTSSRNYSLLTNNKWNKYVQDIKVPNNSNIKVLAIEYKINNINGQVLFDDVRLEPYVAIKNIIPSSSIIELKKGETKNISFNIAPTDATHKDLKLSSDNANIAAVNSQNKIIGVSSGITKIKVEQTYEGLVREIPVIVDGNNNIDVDKINNISAISGQVIDGKVNVKSLDKNLTYSVLVNGKNGYADLNNDGSFKYYINSDFVGTDTFSIKVQDTHGNSTLAQYNMQVASKNLNLEKEDFSATSTENQQAKGIVAVNYLGTVKYEVENGATNGVFTISSNGSYSYQPNSGFFGYDKVKVKVTTDNNKTGTINGTIYVAPKTSTMINKLNTQHPRLLIDQDKFNNIKTLITSDDNAKRWFQTLKKNIDPILSLPVVAYNKADGVRLTTTSKDYIENLSFMYKVTGDVKYADRAWREIENICKYTNWNEDHFLDTSSMAVAAAVGYDWLYDYLNASQKTIIENAIKDKALKKYSLNTWLDSSESNWSIICNSGMIFSSLAIANSTNSDITLKTVETALKSMQTSLHNYYKDGSTFEGSGYWEYATEYLMYANSSIENTLNIKNPFDSILDFNSIAEFPLNISGANGSYNYADTDASVIPSYFNLWIAKKMNQSNLTEYAKICDGRGNAISIFNLLWYDPQLYNGASNTTLDKYFNETQMVTIRSSFDKDYASFIGVKGGTNGVDHSDLDVGNFVYDALGVRWAIDLGKDNYNLSGYFDNESLGERWNVYRKRAEGHNTLVIGSSTNEDQIIGSTSTVIEKNLNSSDPYAVLDMTPAYADKAAKVNRKIQLINNRKDLVIEDSFVLKKVEDVIWQMHTMAKTTVSQDGKSVILEQDNKKVNMTLSADCDGKFEVVDAVPYANSPTSAGQNQNVGVKKIIVKTKVKNGKIKVQMTPMGDVDSMEPIVKNGSFEQDFKASKDWTIWNASGNLNVEADNTVFKDEAKSAKIYNSNGIAAKGSLGQQMNISKYAGKTLKLSQWIKSSNLGGDLMLRYKLADNDWNPIGSEIKTKVNISGTEDWKLIEYTIDIPKNCVNLGLEYLYDNATGTVWVDDVKVQP